MELYYIFGLITLILSVLIGLRLRKAGKEIENNNLTDAGNYWLIINGLSILLTIIMLSKAGLLSFPSFGGPSFCDCVTGAQASKVTAECTEILTEASKDPDGLMQKLEACK
tara:strand:+ start:324 stop:656 length:333 start_codon:yes stop_codon:yes gene_type:complete